MALKDEYPALDQALTEFAAAVAAVKHGMADKHLSVDEIVSAIPDANIRQGVHTQLTMLNTMFTEMGKLASAGPWKMMQYVPDLMGRLMGVFQ